MAQGTALTRPNYAGTGIGSGGGGGGGGGGGLWHDFTHTLFQGADTVAHTAINSLTGLVHMAEQGYHDPWGLATDIGKSYYEDFSHPLRNPWYTAMDIASLAPTPFALADRALEAGRVLGGASGWEKASVTARRLVETPEGEAKMLHTVTPIDTALTRSPTRQFIQAVVHGSPVPERVLKEYAQTPAGGFLTRATGDVTREQRGALLLPQPRGTAGTAAARRGARRVPLRAIPFRTQGGRIAKAATAETRQIKAAARKESLQLLKQFGKKPDWFHEAVAIALRRIPAEDQLKWIDDQIANGGHSGFQLKRFKAWRERTAEAQQYLETYEHTTPETLAPEGTLDPTLNPDHLSMDIEGATGPRVEQVPMPNTPMSEVQVGDRITFQNHTGTVTDMRDAGPFYHVTLDKGRAVAPTAAAAVAHDPAGIRNALVRAPGISSDVASVELLDGSAHAVNPLHPVSADGQTIHLLDGNSADINTVRAVHAGDGTELYRAGQSTHVPPSAAEARKGSTVPIPKNATVDATRTVTHEAPRPTQVMGEEGPQKVTHPGGTYRLSRLKEDAPKDLKDYYDKAKLVADTRESALIAAGRLTHEASFTRRLGSYNVLSGRGLVPDLQKLKHDIVTQTNFGHLDNATKLRSELNYWLKQLNQPIQEGEQTALDFTDMPKPILDPELAKLMSRVPEKLDYAARVPDFLRPWRGGKPKVPGSLSHAYTGAILRAGGPAPNTARLLAESHIEAQRFLYLNAVRADLIARAHDTPVNIPSKYRLPIVTDYYKGHLPPNFRFAEQVMEEGVTNKDELEAASRWYEPIRQLFFDPGSALAYTKARGAPFQTVQEMEKIPIPGIKWVDKRWLGGLDKQNPLFSLLDFPLGRKLIHTADIVNDATKLMILYLKPSYLIPNMLGNIGLTLVHQGFLAPLNMGKTLALMFTKRGLPHDVIAHIKALMGEGFTGSLEGERNLRGLMARASSGAARFYGKIIDDPFRFAAFLHEARLAGFTTLKDVENLVKDGRYQTALHDVATRANDALIDYERLGPAEQSIIRRMVFFYPWVKGSTRYGYHLFINHPFAAAVNVYAGKSGTKYIDEKLGPLPAYEEGLTPLGGGKVMNLSSASILGTGGQVVENLANLFHGHPNPDMNFISDMAPADLFPYTLLTGQTAIGHKKASESNFMAALHQAISNPFFGTPSSIYEQATGGPNRNPSLFPGDTLQSTLIRTLGLGGTMPRDFYDRYANYRAYLANPRAYHDTRRYGG